ncbi:MAG TPA: asparagine synthetase B, partial [Gemmatimonadetes bacterium]|nr:asparagine synthetase B [Gemmatimonadota bacterium]
MAGVFCPLGSRTNVEQSTRAALDKLYHRGPDGEGIYRAAVEGGALTLAHRRLAIIDLSDSGLQPMKSDDERYVITYNGEIYNYVELRKELEGLGHSFRTQTDTEVLLVAWRFWGQKALDKLDGMFAFAVFDKLENTLTCVRDPFGIKPFY